LDSIRKAEICQIPECFKERFAEEDFQVEGFRKCRYERKLLGGYLKFDDFESLRALSTHPMFTFGVEVFISVYDLSHGANPRRSFVGLGFRVLRGFAVLQICASE
jgi:hypothetical protein